MVVYIDLIFLTNLLIDGVLLQVTAWMRKLRPSWWRTLLSAAIGAMYVVMMFVPELSFMFTFLIKFALSVLMLLVAFGFGSLQQYIRTLGAFYIVNFVAAGGILGVHYLLQNSGELFNGIWYTTSGGLSFELQIGMWSVLILLFVTLLLFRIVQGSKGRNDRMAVFLGKVEANIDGVQICCTGLVDTGNQLTDPLTRVPVMVMEASLWSEYLPASWQDRLKDGEADRLIMELGSETFPWQDRLRLVPYRGVNKSTSFMLALKPDQVIITLDGQESCCTRLLIGLDGGRLSSEGKYRAIIHPELLQETKSVEQPLRSGSDGVAESNASAI
ncbi:sigma-E processing peptidase SpoIIGA [Paenibacillus sp. JX-17]|uniref:Sigma-E processing peptidase SpoIIGA n=1 Tax=Paenibacillus lacisoli TaxID=3064525 RepID=A0ABT9CCS3_9BACL|nr:sigma-E processing peptidase SpoIIGA [Paenibacillus sp. JX-17]MDO7905398.1 sigma-E processing peptidase SpoIIGA [Paenibacillus sp. JX-17]